MATKIKKISEFADSSLYGNKSYWLSWLYQNNYKVPYAIFLPAVTEFNSTIQQENNNEILRSLLAPIEKNMGFDIAVRSSSTCEDAIGKSRAGHFKTIIGLMNFEEILYSIKQVIQSLQETNLAGHCKMGVILQKRINAQFAGVAFSSHPVSGNVNQSVISAIRGMGASLVSGEVKGDEILVTHSGSNFTIQPTPTSLPQEKIVEICKIIKDIEKKLDFPVDVEWCIEEGTMDLYLLQCRPATGILREADFVVPVTIKDSTKIDSISVNNKKVSIRLQAEKNKTNISTAHLVYLNRTSDGVQVPSLETLQQSVFCKGYSTVLINPEAFEGKIIRSFAKSETLKDAIKKIGEISRNIQWVSTVIVQEIFDPLYTGIVRKIDDGYLVEIAIGHFIPKGAIATSQYITNENGKIINSKEVTQNHCFKILDGEVVETLLANELVSLPSSQIEKVVNIFISFLANQKITVEFGVAQNTNSDFYIYLIDYIEEKEDKAINSQMVLEGVISQGRITGQLVKLKQDINKSKLDIHFHDSTKSSYITDNPIVFLCENPDISLIEIIGSHNPQKIGFIFREASMLCHLAIILRENGIPAIQLENHEELPFMNMVTIDATTSGLSSKERVVFHD